jgi:phage/plasmid-associated DNA primase
LYNEKKGFWTDKKDEIYGVVHKCSSDIFYDEEMNGTRTYETMFQPVMRLVRSLAPRNDRFQLADDPSKGFLLFRNGVLNFSSQELLPVDPKYHFTAAIDRDWVPPSTEMKQEVRQKLFERPYYYDQKIVYLLKTTARGAAGHFEDRNFVIEIGETGSGKGVKTRALLAALGPFATTFNANELLVGNGHAHGEVSRGLAFLQQICGSRIALSSEMDMVGVDVRTAKKLNATKMKMVTSGGDQVTTRAPYGHNKVVVNRSQLHILVNDIPEAAPADEAFMDRAIYIQQDRSKTDSPIFDEDDFFASDPRISDWVLRPDVCNAFIGLIMDHYSLEKPEKPEWVCAAVKAHSGGNKTVMEFLSDSYEMAGEAERRHADFRQQALNENFYVNSKDLFEAYNNATDYPRMSETKFGMQLTKHGFRVTDKKIAKKTVKVRLGIRQRGKGF